MNDHLETGGQSILSRPAYAKRFGACLAGLFGYGVVLGLAFQSKIMADPISAMQQMFGFIILGNMVVGAFFTLFTYRRALDCEFGQNRKAWIAVLAALPALALPQYGLLVFGAMMLFKSASQPQKAVDVSDDIGAVQPLQEDE
jgi:hypothetical protein